MTLADQRRNVPRVWMHLLRKSSNEGSVREGKEILVRIVSMLTKLVQLYEGESTVKEDGAEYQSN